MSLCAALDLIAFICGTGKRETATPAQPKPNAELSSEDLSGLHSLSGGAQAQKMPPELKADLEWANLQNKKLREAQNRARTSQGEGKAY